MLLTAYRQSATTDSASVKSTPPPRWEITTVQPMWILLGAPDIVALELILE
jgi:hypothetical protein